MENIGLNIGAARLFTDLEKTPDDCDEESVYAFFVFVEEED